MLQPYSSADWLDRVATVRGGAAAGEAVVMERDMYAIMLLEQLKDRVNRFKNDEDGAALIEYTVLLGILLIATIAIIAGVGKWISGEWTALNTAI